MAHQHFVERGTKKNFLGVTELIRKAMDNKVLCGVVSYTFLKGPFRLRDSTM